MFSRTPDYAPVSNDPRRRLARAGPALGTVPGALRLCARR